MPAANSIITDAGSLFSAAAVSAIANQSQKEPVRMTGDAALKPRDIAAICRYLKLPTPTPDISFDDVLALSNLTREAIYVRLSNSTDMDVMIATAALRSGVTRLPDDRRLKPEPHAKAAKSSREPRAASPRSTTPRTDYEDINPLAVIETVAPCPSKPGSERAIRYGHYKVGVTLGAVMELGVRAKDIRRHVADGSITVRQP